MGAPKLKALEIQKAVEESLNSFQQPDINEKLLGLLKKSERKIFPSECRVPKNSKER